MPVIKIQNISNNPNPEKATMGASGYDIRANLDAEIQLDLMERMAVSTGIFIELPFGYEIQIRPRSGLALNHGVTCLNTPGTIDSDYRGEIKIILINLGKEPFTITHGDRIAQMVVQKVENLDWVSVAFVEPTERNTNGFGHTGTK